MHMADVRMLVGHFRGRLVVTGDASGFWMLHALVAPAAFEAMAKGSSPQAARGRWDTRHLGCAAACSRYSLKAITRHVNVDAYVCARKLVLFWCEATKVVWWLHTSRTRLMMAMAQAAPNPYPMPTHTPCQRTLALPIYQFPLEPTAYILSAPSA